MTEAKFVYPAHPLYEPYLDLAETTELEPVFKDTVISPLRYQHVEIPYSLAYGNLGWNPITGPEWSKEPGRKEQEFWHRQEGLNTLSSYKLWPDGYVNEGLRMQNGGRSIQAIETIAYGIGTLRPRKVEGKGFDTALGNAVRRVDSKFTQRQGTYIVDAPFGRSFALESTNLVMPEVVGELRQIKQRAGEKAFLLCYLHDMTETLKPTRAYDGIDFVPQALASILPAWRAAHLNHLKTGTWSKAPEDISELVDRVDRLLEDIEIDESPVEISSVSTNPITAL